MGLREALLHQGSWDEGRRHWHTSDCGVICDSTGSRCYTSNKFRPQGCSAKCIEAREALGIKPLVTAVCCNRKEA